MQRLRRRFAVCALLLTVIQAAVAFAAPLATCCPSRAASVQADEECCPAGSHPPGECPRHGVSKPARAGACRLQCDAPHAGGYLIVAVGMLPSSVSAFVPAMETRRFPLASIVPVFRTLLPDSPPPRLL